MSIDIETFEDTSPEELSEMTNPERVLRFLLANDDKAFKAAEIADGADVDRNSISTVLGRLDDRSLVRHKGEYWALGDLERIVSFGRYQRITRQLNDQLGAEDREAWLEHAADESERNSSRNDDER